MFGTPLHEQPWAYCPTCYYPAYRYQVGQQCPVCEDHFVLNEERAEAENTDEEE